ncbi:hypothetical protein WISP_121200 [Willisornis vidua]|uniref:Uncharacterized protein n=1 Tax=Willisornis vidua TaxID=1566151 RepID=A0ABQ9CVG7_9PASS|nr:hypothetical protein WISP_121200 [Willisornis vidua]
MEVHSGAAIHLQALEDPMLEQSPTLLSESRQYFKRKDHERALREAKETLQKLPEEIRRDIRQDKEKLLQDARGRKEVGAPGLPQRLFRQPVGAVGQEPADPDVRQRREKIKECQMLQGDLSKEEQFHLSITAHLDFVRTRVLQEVPLMLW